MFPIFSYSSDSGVPFQVIQGIDANESITFIYSGLVKLTSGYTFQIQYSCTDGVAECDGLLCNITVFQV